MKLKKLSYLLSMVALTAGASSTAFAQESAWDQPGWYLGGNIGQANADLDNSGITNRVLSSGFTINSLESDDTYTSFKVFGGYQFNKYFALEAGYFDLGQFDLSATTTPTGTFDGSVEFIGVNLDLVGRMPINEKLSAFARVGANYAKTVDNFSGTNAVVITDGTREERDTNVKAGLGLQYAFNDNLAMRVEAERYRVSDAVGGKGDVDVISLGLVYRFGATAKPAPVMPMPAAAPMPEPVQPEPEPEFEKYTLSATELFAFDSDKVREPQPKLVKIAEALKTEGAPKHVVVTGYSDRLGSSEYNQKLSERRAQAVKNYMVSKGVDAQRLKVEGKGEANPVVTCTDTKKAELIKCLGPNRRVEIDKITITREINN